MTRRVTNYRRFLGFSLILLALSMGIIIALGVSIQNRVGTWAIAETLEGCHQLDGNPPYIPIPPWNASEENPPRGWVGFNVSLKYRGKKGYEVKGLILPADEDKNPQLVMYVVNQSALILLIFDNFRPEAWDEVKIYSFAYLNGTMGKLHDDFVLQNLDTDKYVFLFRCLKNDTRDRPIAMFLKETWLEEQRLLEPTMTNNVLVIALFVTGTSLLVVRKSKKAE